eukprot:3872119-Amphidinium_carterae.2
MDDGLACGVKRSVEEDEAFGPAKAARKQETEVLKTNRSELEDSDPLYALIGEVGDVEMVLDDGTVKEELLLGFVQRLMLRGASKRGKDWVAFWAAMRIPTMIESQAAVLK